MEILKATGSDLNEIAHLFNAYRVFYNQKSDLAGAASYINDRLKNGDSVIFVVKEGDSYLGFTQLYPTFSSISMKRVWILNDLYVEESARKRGIGERLMKRARQHAIETGAAAISLSTAPDNHTAQKLYERQGYERDQQFYHYELTI